MKIFGTVLTDKKGKEIFGNMWKWGGSNFIYECPICGSIYNVFPYGSNAKFFCVGTMIGIESSGIKRINDKEERCRKLYGSSRYHQAWEMKPREIKPDETEI